MNHFQTIASLVILSATALSFGCASQVGEPDGAGDNTSSEAVLTEDALSMTSEEATDEACTSEDEEAVSESAEAVRLQPPPPFRPPRECRRYFRCTSRYSYRFCNRRYPYLARICRGFGGFGGHGDPGGDRP